MCVTDEDAGDGDTVMVLGLVQILLSICEARAAENKKVVYRRHKSVGDGCHELARSLGVGLLVHGFAITHTSSGLFFEI